MTTYPDIIPYNSWIHSQLSIARHYGSIQLDGKTYEVDYIFAEDGEDGFCFPDLVESSLYMKMQKDNPEKVKLYYSKIKS